MAIVFKVLTSGLLDEAYTYIYIYILHCSLRAKRSKRQRASGASFSWLMGTSRKAVSRKRSILDIWCWEQKVFVLTQLVDIWSEPARPDPTRPDPARPDRHAFERLITRKLSIIQKKVFRHKMFVNFIKLMY